MTIEEKARAYDEAIEKARKLATDLPNGRNDRLYHIWDLESIFPELAESEDEDERVREALIRFHKSTIDIDGIKGEDIIAWLEKQEELKSSNWTEGDVVRHGGILALVTNGRKAMKSNFEQITIQYPDEWVKAETKERKYFFEVLEKQGEKPSNVEEPNFFDDFRKTDSDVEPKFKVGYWIVDSQGLTHQIERVVENVTTHTFGYDIVGGGYFNDDSDVHLWTIADAKDGDWIISDCNNVAYIESISGTKYNLQCKDGYHEKMSVEYVDKCWHPWTIQDAKDGDVLAAHECIVLFKEIDGLNIKCYCTYHYMGFNPSFHIDTLQNKDAFHPATKEQRDTLMKAMADVGYEWDADKKELRKIEQKSAWSEEDEKNLQKAIWYVENPALNVVKDIMLSEWLKSLKQRLGGEK